MLRNQEKLLQKYIEGQCTGKEKAIVESWYLKFKSETDNPDHKLIEKSRKQIWESLSANQKKTAFNKWSRISYAAVILITFLVGIFFYFNDRKANTQLPLAKVEDITRGGNKAFLTLANGKKISLTDAANGQVAREAGLAIIKKADGEIVYNVLVNENIKSSSLQYNTIETPRGGKYQVNLPDGSKVWLNSSSSLHYPARFASHKRIVELTGEAYFEVAKDKTKPFVVQTNQQEVEVLGTHFNINSYPDEPSVKTTLIEGSVKVRPAASNADLSRHDQEISSASRLEKILKPGEQSRLRDQRLKISPADIESVMAWKNGDFIFEDDDLQSIMRQLSRWYNVDITYQGNFDHLRFGGYVSRSKNISSVLNIMESTGKVHFKIEGRKIIVISFKPNS